MGTITGKATDLITFSRGSLATVTDSDGKVKWAAHNLALNSATPATQNITTIVGAKYKVEMTGSGSVALSGAGTGTASAGTSAEITATTTTLTLTVSGTVSTMWAYRSDLGGMQLNGAGTTYNVTTSAPYYGPRLDFDPVTLSAKGLLVEEQRTNLVTYSNDFTNGAWGKSGLSATPVIANAVASPDGATNAAKIVESATTAEHLIARSSLGTGTLTFSVRLKAAERTQAVIYFYNATDGASSTYFNLANGTVVSGSGKIVPAGNGFYICSITRTATATDGIYWGPAVAGNGSYAGDGTSGIYAYGAQLEAGSFATSYIPTTSATVTRSADLASVATSQFPHSSTEGTWVANFQTIVTGNVPVAVTLLNYDATGTRLPLYIGAGAQVVGSYDGTTVVSSGVDGTGQITKAAVAYTASGRAISAQGSAVVTGVSTPGFAAASTINFGTAGAGLLNGWLRQISYFPRRMTNAELQQRTAA